MSSRARSLVAAVVLTAAVGLGMNACTRSDTSTSAFKVALLNPGPISDAGWNASAYEGLLAIRDQLGAEISQAETKTPPEFEQAFRDYARRGYRLVIGHGFEFQDAAARVAPDFPNTIFITTSGNTVRPNVAPIVFRLEEATFLLGELAARMAPDGSACAVGGMEIPSVKSTFLAFQAGTAHAKAGYPVTFSYLGNWDDVGAARTATLALIDRGCRFVLQNADAAGPGVFQAATERGIFAFGSNRAQHEVGPKAVLASAVIDIRAAFVSVAREVKDGTFKSRIIEKHLADGAISVVYSPTLAVKIPADVHGLIERTETAIRDGSLKVPTAEF